ncbi:MAG: hypothetical protein FWC51_03995 [Proteobacteria bacterium]|nr:hypothetical protein [Pseudomonadota bacterium]
MPVLDEDAAVNVVMEFLKDNRVSHVDYQSIAANKGLTADIIGTIYGNMASKATKLRAATAGNAPSKNIK